MNSGKNIVSNLIWRFAERCGAQLVAFLVSVVLARLLDPSEYGTVALITVFTTLMQVFVDSGLGNALIQKKEADDLDFSTVFYTNIVFCTVLYAVMFFSAHRIAEFYQDTRMAAYIRVLSLTILISGVKNVQQAYVSRKMLFRKFFFSTLGGTIAAGIIGVAMAFNGLGIWALVAQQVINLSIDTLILWLTVKWRPKLLFSFKRLKTLFAFGWKLLVSALMETLYKNLSSLIIGKIYSSADLGYYNQGEKFPKLVVNNINTSIDSVLFPALSAEQDDKTRVREMTRRAIKISTYLMAPMMIGLAVVSEPLVRLVLTEKWLLCVPFMRVFCISFLFYPIHTANLNAIKALGRSDLFLKLEIVKKILGLILLVVTMQLGPLAMAYGVLASSLISQLINAAPNAGLLDYGYRSQISDMVPNLLASVLMGIPVYLISLTGLTDVVMLMLQVICGLTLYLIFTLLFKLDSFTYLLEIGKNFYGRKNNKV